MMDSSQSILISPLPKLVEVIKVWSTLVKIQIIRAVTL